MNGVFLCQMVSFREVPDVFQEEYSQEVLISWNEAYINLSKCVDYYYVEYAAIPNGTDATKPGFAPQYSTAAVQLQKKKLSDRWEDSLRPFLIKYSAKINVEYDTRYIIRVLFFDMEGFFCNPKTDL